ncbi:MAG: MiaB/RimO family radical SAM methylthiotransferase [Treponema sp.]|jgi:threonylcarbamoyladenosine tRNA methylthiotransferase MtaB|nr:MiaB/RimO family radical SAM methylthiotransferase [Treponema sp.]
MSNEQLIANIEQISGKDFSSFLIHTLGCKVNQLESEAIAETFLQLGFQVSATDLPAVIVVNTCTVTSKADQKARRVIRKALRDYPDSCVIVTGCYAKLNKDDLLKLETDGKKRLFVIDKENIINFEFNPQGFSSRTRSFLKIQDGCDKHCTYCKIRLARGPSVSLDAVQVLERLRILEKTNAEAVLTGVNICQYRNDKLPINNFAELVDYLLKGTSRIAIRLSSLAPDSVDENLAKTLSHKRIRPHFHLSIQSCSQKILEKMGRNYKTQTIEKACELLRSAKQDPFLACDIITGFPGETEAEFEQTYSLCKKLDFAWIHVFPYSKRPGTAAWSFSEPVHSNEIKSRVKLLTDLAFQGKEAYVRRWLGKEVDVLIEQDSLHCRGTTENYLKAAVKYNGEKTPEPGSVLRCRLVEENLMRQATKDVDVIAQEV